MIIKRIKIKNIRSYSDEEIKFPEGTIMLSGDIGSGKSTILLSIEFALFGIKRGELSGNALLRNGSDDGYVILDFNIDNNVFSVKRTLKRSVNGITQDSGFLSINDVTQQLTPVELKQRVTQLLNYPLDSLSKKSLTYRYTVYTPQEEMKLILLGEKEYRLETLRKVFNIDKYKRIKENSKIILTEAKQKKKDLSLFVSDLEPKKLLFKEKELKLSNIYGNILLLNEKLLLLNSELVMNKDKIVEFENSIKRLNDIKKDFELIKFNIKSKEDIKNKNILQLSQLEKQIIDISSNIKEINFEDVKQNIIDNEKNVDDMDKELKIVNNNISSLRTKKVSSIDIKNQITKLDNCPLCKQVVSVDYKNGVISREDESLLRLDIDIKDFLIKESEFVLKIKEIKILIQDFKNKERDFEINKIRIKDLESKKESLNKLKKENEDLDFIIKELNDKRLIIQNDIESNKELENNYLINKKLLEQLLDSQKKLELSIVINNKDKDFIEKELVLLKSEIENKEKASSKLDYYIKLCDWLDSFFINVIDIIEKKTMSKLHSDFSDLFQKWFSMLIDESILKVRLDEEFTPIIEQNSHDIEYENLSGGEKTSCALAYRLALNQVINNISNSINTKDLIILDEPTDGFSEEQLDKIRDIIKELKMRQIIIVSHENKVESFVDNVIKIRKDNHISKVIR
ncbi:MAG: SMC family ATPase [Nanoarchaeota archaeon]